MFIYPVADLHCDLLAYLTGGRERTPYDLRARCSIPQLQKGPVQLQVMAIYTPTEPGSSHQAMEQFAIFTQMPMLHPEAFAFSKNVLQPSSKQTDILFAIENASGLCDEDEPLSEAFKRLQHMQQSVGYPLYISLTWNSENRFGGGALAPKGLKDDGRRLLDHLHQKRIAVDFSHASDPLACDILEHIDTNDLDIPVLASHSNIRSVTDVARNLPDEIAQEIIHRRGVIGLNFIRYFVGKDSPQNFVKHLQKVLEWGGEDQVCIGADFFYEEDVPADLRKQLDELFFPEFDNAGTYAALFDLWRQHLGLSQQQLSKIAHANLYSFLNRGLA